MNTLIQKDGRNSKHFEIQEDGVFVKNNFAKEINEYKVYFPDIQNDETVFRKKKDPVLIGIAISMVFNSILLTIVINNNYELSYSMGMVAFAVALIPTLIVTAICNNEFRKENSKKSYSFKAACFFLYKKRNEGC